MLHVKMGGILPSNIKNKQTTNKQNPCFCRNKKMCNSLNKISSLAGRILTSPLHSFLREPAILSAGAERTAVSIHLLLLYHSSIFQKYICMYIYRFQIYREYFL